MRHNEGLSHCAESDSPHEMVQGTIELVYYLLLRSVLYQLRTELAIENTTCGESTKIMEDTAEDHRGGLWFA